jgi:hypothetical protein
VLVICEFIGTVLGWEPDRFVYRAGPVPTGPWLCDLFGVATTN